MSKKAIFRPMTELERERAVALGKCGFSIGSFSKRFARDLSAQARAPEPTITDKQAHRLEVQCYIFRRQLPARLVPEKPADYLTPAQRAKEAELAAYKATLSS